MGYAENTFVKQSPWLNFSLWVILIYVSNWHFCQLFPLTINLKVKYYGNPRSN